MKATKPQTTQQKLDQLRKELAKAAHKNANQTFTPVQTNADRCEYLLNKCGQFEELSGALRKVTLFLLDGEQTSPVIRECEYTQGGEVVFYQHDGEEMLRAGKQALERDLLEIASHYDFKPQERTFLLARVPSQPATINASSDLR